MCIASDCPSPIASREIAAVIDRHMPSVFEFALGPADLDDVGSINGMLAAAEVLISQYNDPFSEHSNASRALTTAYAALDRVLSASWENVHGYGAGFVAWCLYDCMQTCLEILPASYLERMRTRLKHMARILLDNPWDFERDSRVNCEVVQASGLAMAGWALGDESLVEASRERMAIVVNQHCDENAVPSEISLAYLPQMIVWAALAAEVADMPDNTRLISGISSIASLFFYKDTFEPMGPDCREPWKTIDRYVLDAWLLALKIGAVVCNDGQCEWLARSIFRRWQFHAQPGSAVYSSRAPRYLGSEKLGFGFGAANSPELAGSRATYMAGMLCTLKRWNKKEIAPQTPEWLQSYRSSKLTIVRQERGPNTIMIGNVLNPVSYYTDQLCLQAFDLWSDDSVFWLLGCDSLPRHESEGAITFRQRLGPEGEHTSITAQDHIIRSVKIIGDQVVFYIKIDCSVQLPPGIQAFGGLLLSYDRTGRIFFRRNGCIEQSAFSDDQNNCDWVLYPSGPKRRFGFALLHFSTSSNGRKLCNSGAGDWCTLEFRHTEEPIPCLRASAVLLIGPWEGPTSEYDRWIAKWKTSISQNELILASPEGQRFNIPIDGGCYPD